MSEAKPVYKLDNPLLTPREVSQLFRYPRGRAVKLAKAGLLPAIFLPDGEVRFERKAVIEALTKMSNHATIANTERKFVSALGLSNILGLPLAWLKAEAKAGRIPSLMVGRRRMFDANYVRHILAERAERELQQCLMGNGENKNL